MAEAPKDRAQTWPCAKLAVAEPPRALSTGVPACGTELLSRAAERPSARMAVHRNGRAPERPKTGAPNERIDRGAEYPKRGDLSDLGRKRPRAEDALNKLQRDKINPSVKHLSDPVIMTPMQACPSKQITTCTQSINQSINESIHRSINQSINT